MKPHKIRYWLHSTEKAEDPASFNQKVNEICDLYKNAQELSEQGTHVVSVDEMTGIQALERKYPDKPPVPGMTAKMEFEYIRHGTTTLIGCFNIAGGTVYHPFLHQTRTEEDFRNAISEVVQNSPDDKWMFICDKLNIHMSESLVRYVAQTCNLHVDLGIKGQSGVLENMKTRSEFLHDPSHRIRFVYTPKHSSWLNQIEIWFGIISRRLLKRKSYTSVDELKNSIRRFVTQYNITAHPFKWTYAGVPLVV